jgi:hypothetical protein
MGKYTADGKYDKVIDEKLKIVTDILVDGIKKFGLRSIILVGGYGRGEGSVLNGEVFNDFDIYVVTDKKVNDKICEDVGMEASKAINKGGKEFIETDGRGYDVKEFFHVDVRNIRYKKLKKLKKLTRTFELKYGSSVLYGNDVRNEINIDEELPVSEGWRHMINKSCHLLLAMDPRRLKGNFEKDEDKIAAYYAIKSIMACGESLLLLKKRFKASYKEKNELFKELYKDELPGLVKKVDYATKLKLNFDFSKIKDVVKLWKASRDCLFFTIKYLAEKEFGIKTENKRVLMRKLYKKLPYYYHRPYIPFSRVTFIGQYLLNILYFFRTGYFRSLLTWRDAGVRVLFPAFLLLYSFEEPLLNRSVERYLKKLAPIKGDSWEELRKSVLYAYGKYYTQKLI